MAAHVRLLNCIQLILETLAYKFHHPILVALCVVVRGAEIGVLAPDLLLNNFPSFLPLLKYETFFKYEALLLIYKALQTELLLVFYNIEIGYSVQVFIITRVLQKIEFIPILLLTLFCNKSRNSLK